jgi:peptidoglycan/xylan/chitin deacetylase (PgdA/CDA1 family)
LSKLVISLDFELFWGVAESRTIDSYYKNIAGTWDAIPQMLRVFKKFGVRATWATVGMVMCRDYAQWRALRPVVLPGYARRKASTYLLDSLAQQYPKLFFGRSLVEQVAATPGQEVASHTYSHFYCQEIGTTREQFAADLACAQEIAGELNLRHESLVFPRNQVNAEFLAELPRAGIKAYRGNPDHWLYRDGHSVPGGIAGRAVRLADTWFPLSGANVSVATQTSGGLTNIPASIFLRRRSASSALESLRLRRVRQAMTSAAERGGNCHIWWHPHNFGIDVDRHIKTLEVLLEHYLVLRDRYGMTSASMAEVANDSAVRMTDATRMH